jgi:hypothetical protein
VNTALRAGLRGLPGGSSLARLLARRRGVRNKSALPPLTEEGIAQWAERHRRTTGILPTDDSGPVTGARGETWKNLDQALRLGYRGLPGGDSLAKLLARVLGARNRTTLPRLTVEGILVWADWHRERTGRWPTKHSGEIEGTGGETWYAVESALKMGARGLPGGSSLIRLLAEHRGVTNPADKPRLTPALIREWARSHQERTGKRPTADSGPVAEAPGETWRGVNHALWQGLRGLPGGSSLSKLLRG